MNFGQRESFAVSADIDADCGGEWLYGKFCYWIAGTAVGDYAVGTSLRDVLFQMKHVISDCGNRDGGKLCELPHQDIFDKLDTLLYGNAAVNPDDIDSPARFNISIPVDVFDEWKIYLVECGDSARIIFKKNSDKNIKLHVLRKGEFDEAIKEAYRHLDSVYQTEVDRSIRHH